MCSYGSTPDGGLSQRRRIPCLEETSEASDGFDGAESSISAQKLKQGRLGQASYAIIDVSSCYIVGWGMYNTLDASNAIEVLDKAVARYGAPEIINSNQGVQYTYEDWHRACDGYGIRISMDGRARCLDNVWIERFWRTIKREYVYLNPESTVGELRRGIMQYLDYYNNRCCHQGLAHQTPRAVYAAVAA